MTDNASLLETAKQVAYPNYRPAPFVLTRGRGCRVEDVEGRSFLDLSGGIAVLSVGHCHPELAEAIAEQAARLMHVSNLFYNDRAIELAAEITKRTPFDRVYFANSGAEANEALLKLARHHHYGLGDAVRVELVGTLKSFHGRTLGALSLTGQPKYHKGMEPLLGGVKLVPYGDLDAMREVVGDKTAAVLVEPLQAEGGLVVPPEGYLEGLRELTRERGALLLFDEVQTGYGRTGTFLAQEQYGVVPDACSLAKGIGGGFPLAAMAVTEKLAGALPPGTHASTFGGNALACAAGLAVLRIFDQEGLVERAASTGEHLRVELEKLAAKHECVVDARGRGLLRGLALADDVDAMATLHALRDKGLLLTLAGGFVLRISPPLNVTPEELDEGLAIVDALLADPPRKDA
ncbi:MAG: acetylornithine/succinylornithine family transaminase [Deltaproteobacteria bacterium]|nr:acetylornithine/succinylornithine family transaminase [Deltaproteobacteria bacterium]